MQVGIYEIEKLPNKPMFLFGEEATYAIRKGRRDGALMLYASFAEGEDEFISVVKPTGAPGHYKVLANQTIYKIIITGDTAQIKYVNKLKQ